MTDGTIPRPQCCKECLSSNVNLVARSPWENYSHTWECASCGLVLGAAKANQSGSATTVTANIGEHTIAVGLHGAQLYVVVDGTLYEVKKCEVDGINAEPFEVWSMLSDGKCGWDYDAVHDFASALVSEVYG